MLAVGRTVEVLDISLVRISLGGYMRCSINLRFVRKKENTVLAVL